MERTNFYFDESGQPGINRGSEWHVVAMIYAPDKKDIAKTYLAIKKELIKINPIWKNKALKSCDENDSMQISEQKIVLEELVKSNLGYQVSKCHMHSFPSLLEKNQCVVFEDTGEVFDPTGLETRHYAFPPWAVIDPIKTKILGASFFYEGKKFQDNKKRWKGIYTHLKRQLDKIPFRRYPRDYKKCEGVQIADVLANSFYRHLNKEFYDFDKIIKNTCEVIWKPIQSKNSLKIKLGYERTSVTV